MKKRNNLERVQEKKSIDRSKEGRSFASLVVIPLLVALTMIGVGVLAIATDYKGSIDLKLGPDGGHLKINR